MTVQTIAAKANHYSTVAHDGWKLGTITSSVFADVTDLCQTAIVEAKDFGDFTAADNLIDQAADLLVNFG